MKAHKGTDGTVIYWCPGCDGHHGVATDPNNPNTVTGAKWRWNGSLEKPTFEPSVLVHSVETIKRDAPDRLPTESIEEWCDKHRVKTPRCHHYVRDGRIEFLSDCEHSLAGQTVDMVEED